jgi:hypothetical protein
VLTDDAVPGSSGGDRAPSGDRLPQEYRGTVGALTSTRTVPQLRRFVESGGTLLSIGDSTAIASRLGVPVSSALITRDGDRTRPLAREEYYIPGSVLQVAVDNTTPLGYGFERQVDVFFEDSPVFRLDTGQGGDVRRVAWFAGPAPLRSGWAWGQKHLEGGVAVVDAGVGQGRVLLFGPEINFRAQPHGTFKFLFNGIYYGRALPVGSVGKGEGGRG